METIKKSGLGLICILTIAITTFVACEKDNSPLLKSDIEGIAYDAVSYVHLEGAVVTVIEVANSGSGNSGPVHAEAIVDADGRWVFHDLPHAVYNMYIALDGYKQMFCNNIDLIAGEDYVAFLPVTTEIVPPIGGIAGKVLNPDGEPLANANVSISAMDETITNGYFSSVMTNEDGQFFIGAVPLQFTQEFKVRCIADGYDTAIVSDISILHNEMVITYIYLETGTPANEIFYEDFEGDGNDWEKTGFWHMQPNAEIYNQAYPEHVKLAPNDNSGNRIPNAYKGTKTAWYGEAEPGNYLGEQSIYDYDLSGGTSTNPNSGELISPIINLSNLAEASLNFWSWFEIESVNPNEQGYDLMEVYVVQSNGSLELLGKLNPYIDPIIPDRSAVPFTSGGFNQAPVWKYESFDLGEYVGTAIRLKFHFNTRDGLYNGFRGWFIDELHVIDKGVAGTKTKVDTTRPLMQREQQ